MKKKRKRRVFLTTEQRNEVYLLVLRGESRKVVAEKYNTSIQQVGLIFNSKYIYKAGWKREEKKKETEQQHANNNTKNQIIQKFSRYGMTSCSNCGKLTSIDNPCHQQITTVNKAA